MHKLIHSDFELDLSIYQLDIMEENPYFSDKYFTKYTFPFSIKLTTETKHFFEYIIDYNSTEIITQFDVIYVNNNKLVDAQMLIEELNNDEIVISFAFGLDEFKNFNKQLSELNLEKLQFESPNNIYNHAKQQITKTYPEVNYNFPAVHVDNINTEEGDFFYFQKIINNYKDGEFLQNEVVDEITYNRNIIQPVPYWLYILKKGFLEAGYELKGDVLEIDILKKMLAFSNRKYYKLEETNSIDLTVFGDEVESNEGNGTYNKEFIIPHKGKYKISGTIFIYIRYKKKSYVKIYYNNKLITSRAIWTKIHHSGYLYSYNIHKTFTTDPNATEDKIVIKGFMYWQTSAIFSGTADVVYLSDANGNPIPNILIKNEIDLNVAVPNMSFGEFVGITRSIFNLNIFTKGNEIWMNYINSQINYTNVKDLSNFEVKYPNRKLNNDESFVLKYSDVDSEIYKYSSIFINRENETIDNYVTNDNTKIIEIKALPLPLISRNDIQTAHDFEGNEEKVYPIIYDGLQNGLNTTLENTELLIPSIYEKFYNQWINFRIRAILFKWNFTSWIEDIFDIESTSKIFAYNNIHFIKSINKKEIKEDLFDVEIETYRM